MARYPELPARCFVQVADFAEFSLRAAGAGNFSCLVWGCFFGKLVKLAQGHPYTHAGHAALDMRDLAGMVGWPEEQLHWTTLGELAQCVTRHNLTRQTVFLVLPAQNEEGAPSRLYAADFSHGCRTAAS